MTYTVILNMWEKYLFILPFHSVCVQNTYCARIYICACARMCMGVQMYTYYTAYNILLQLKFLFKISSKILHSHINIDSYLNTHIIIHTQYNTWGENTHVINCIYHGFWTVSAALCPLVHFSWNLFLHPKLQNTINQLPFIKSHLFPSFTPNV